MSESYEISQRSQLKTKSAQEIARAQRMEQLLVGGRLFGRPEEELPQLPASSNFDGSLPL